MLQYSIVFHCYSTLAFSIARVLIDLRCYSTQLFLVVTACEAAQSFYKMIELGRGRVRATRGSAARG
jgi:hypothetical protein